MSIEDAEETRENLYSGCGCHHGKIEVPTVGNGRWVEKLAQAVPVKSHAEGMFAKCRSPLLRRPCVLCRGLGCPQPAFQNIRKGYSETLLAKDRENMDDWEEKYEQIK